MDFIVVVGDPCPTATIAYSTAYTTENYYVAAASDLVLPITFTSTEPTALCGAWGYTVTDSSGTTALDSTVFTFDSTAATLTVSTLLLSKVNTYSVMIVASQGTYTSNYGTLSFSVDILDPCPSATISVPTITT